MKSRLAISLRAACLYSVTPAQRLREILASGRPVYSMPSSPESSKCGLMIHPSIFNPADVQPSSDMGAPGPVTASSPSLSFTSSSSPAQSPSTADLSPPSTYPYRPEMEKLHFHYDPSSLESPIGLGLVEVPGSHEVQQDQAWNPYQPWNSYQSDQGWIDPRSHHDYV